jgi:DNA polymerase-3 subunit delta
VRFSAVVLSEDLMPFCKSQEYYHELKSGSVRPVYAFAGEETYLLEEAFGYLDKLMAVDALNREVYFGQDASVDDIIIAAQTLPFMGDRRLVVVKDAQKIRSADAGKLAEFLKVPERSCCIVLFWNEKLRKDSRKSPLLSAAAAAGMTVEFRALYENELPAWVQQRVRGFSKRISLEAGKCLIQESGSNLMDLTNELEKLDLYTGARDEITVKDVEAVSGHTRLSNLNHLAEGIEGKRIEASVRIMENLIAEGEVPLRVLATISRIIRRLLIAKSLLEEKKSSHQEIRQELNLNPYFDKNFFNNLSLFTLSGLEEGMGRILAADAELKQSARPETMILEELILALCRK